MRAPSGLLAVMLVLACSQKSTDRPSGVQPTDPKEPAPAATSSDAASVATPSQAAKPGSVDGLPAVEGVPALDLTVVEEAKLAAADRLYAEGLELQRRRIHAGAIATYVAALKEDPGHLLAWYNLASSLNASGDTPHALWILAQLRREGSRASRGILLHSRTDKDWAAQQSDPLYLAIVADVTVEPFDAPGAAQQIATALGKGRAGETLAAWVAPRAPVFAGCDFAFGSKRTAADERPEGMGEENPLQRLVGWKAVAQFVGDERYPPAGRKLDCDAKPCCRYQDVRGLGRGSYLGELCFDGMGGALFLSKIAFVCVTM